MAERAARRSAASQTGNTKDTKTRRTLRMQNRVEPRAYEEVIHSIASGTSPRTVADYHPSQEARDRVADLVAPEKTGELSAVETAELETALRLEHIMRLPGARARQHL